MYISQAAYGFFALSAFIAGVILGAVYDIFRIRRISAASGCGSVKLTSPVELRRIISVGRKRAAEIKQIKAQDEKLQKYLKKTFIAAETIRYLFIFIEDIVFAVIAALTVSVLTYSANSGYVRWFGLAMAGAGFLSYYNTVGRLVKLCAEYIIYALRAAVAILIGVIERILINPMLYVINKTTASAVRAVKKRVLSRYMKRRMHLLREQANCGFMPSGKSAAVVPKMKLRLKSSKKFENKPQLNL